MHTTRFGAPLTLVVLAVAGLVACSGGLGYGGGNTGGSVGGGYGGGGDGGGGVGGGQVGSVRIGTGIQFVSGNNGSMNPAVDTIVAGSAMTWTWSGALPHSVHSVGTPSFASSGVLTGAGTYAVTLTTPGTYRYECGVHGNAMTGAIIVIPAAGANDVTGL